MSCRLDELQARARTVNREPIYTARVVQRRVLNESGLSSASEWGSPGPQRRWPRLASVPDQAA
jgi:hypothetical protein